MALDCEETQRAIYFGLNVAACNRNSTRLCLNPEASRTKCAQGRARYRS